MKRVDQIIAVPAWLVVGCVWAYSRLPGRKPSDAVWLVAACALTMGFFEADMALFQPRYLPLFRVLLHPHSPW